MYFYHQVEIIKHLLLKVNFLMQLGFYYLGCVEFILTTSCCKQIWQLATGCSIMWEQQPYIYFCGSVGMFFYKEKSLFFAAGSLAVHTLPTHL
jgi:hypothetical protein